MPVLARFKSCDVCRQRGRPQYKKTQEKQARAAALTAAHTNLKPVAHDLQDARPRDVEMREWREEPLPVDRVKKRKADAILETGGSAVRIPSKRIPHKEYRTEQELLDALRLHVKKARAARTSLSTPPTYLNFNASFTIVMDPAVSSERRAKRVVAELLKTAKLQLGILKRPETDRTIGAHARSYWCSCHPIQPQALTGQPTSSSSVPPLRRTQSTLKCCIAAPNASLDDVPPPPGCGCGGTVTVRAVTDLSHPLAQLGIKGHKVTVRIDHLGLDLRHAIEWT